MFFKSPWVIVLISLNMLVACASTVDKEAAAARAQEAQAAQDAQAAKAAQAALATTSAW